MTDSTPTASTHNPETAMDTLQEAKQILSACLFVPVEKIGDDDDINTVQEMDSLSFGMIVTEVEKRTGRDVDPMRLIELRSVRDLAALLQPPA
jgi:acyl carrier protein